MITLLLIAIIEVCGAEDSALLQRLAAVETELASLRALIVNRAAAAPSDPLHGRECFNDDSKACPTIPPLDSPVVWSKEHDKNSNPDTHSILALVQNETASASFPWPLYIQLTTAHQMGDAVGAYVRMYKTGRVEGAGGMKDPWQAAFHTDLGNSENASGCSIGTNIEITNPSPDVNAIGINLHLVSGHAYAAVNIQEGPWVDGVHTEPGSHGETAVKIEGNWTKAGLDLGMHDLRLGRGARIVFEESNDPGGSVVALAYNHSSNQMELRRGSGSGGSGETETKLLWSA
jgi:hypothetical protein